MSEQTLLEPKSNAPVKSFLQSKYVHVLTAAILVQAALFYSASRGEVVPVNAPLSSFPTTLDDWHVGREDVIDADTRDVLKADDLMSRVYVGSKGAASLFVAYFRTQRAGQAPHSPKNCLPGSGWQPSENGKIDVDVKGETIHINHYVVSRGDEKSLVLYWYQSQGRVIADEFAAKFYLVADSIKKHRSDTALVRVVLPVPPGRDAQAEELGREFVREFYPAVRNYLPH